MARMSWHQLLSTKRVKGLYGLSSSDRGDDRRSEYERDFGRSVFSTPVRRLQDKAQVFPLEEHDAVRTRLTHSLEVSNVAKGLAQRVSDALLKSNAIDLEQRDAITTIAATCGLIHDLGNPPFGHAGEQAISQWFEQKSPDIFSAFQSHADGTAVQQTQYALDFLHFEGNAQTQRLLSRLQVLADDFGLNLTCATLSASCKYVARSDTRNSTNQAFKKHGYFASENDLMSLLRSETGTGEARNPITILVEASDDIVYAVVDLEDGIKKGCLSWQDLRSYLSQNHESSCLQACFDKVEFMLRDATLKDRGLDEARASAFRTVAITEMVQAVSEEFLANYEEIMEGRYAEEILYRSRAATLAKGCKSLASFRVYLSPQVMKRELLGRRVINDLMDLYWQAADAFSLTKEMKGYPKRIYNLISPNYRHVFERSLREAHRNGIPESYYRMQLVTDQISGMTDTFAVNLHRELVNG